MNTLKLILIGLVCVFSCCASDKTEKAKTEDRLHPANNVDSIIDKDINSTVEKADSTYSDIIRNRLKSVYELDTDDYSSIWYSGKGDWSGCVFFEKGIVNFLFSVSCGYWYETSYIDKHKIIFIWDYHENCTYNIGMKKTFDVSKVPIKDKPFGEFILINDTTLKVNYYYPEWVEKINAHRKEIVFPSELTLDPRIFPLN